MAIKDVGIDNRSLLHNLVSMCPLNTDELDLHHIRERHAICNNVIFLVTSYGYFGYLGIKRIFKLNGKQEFLLWYYVFLIGLTLCIYLTHGNP